MNESPKSVDDIRDLPEKAVALAAEILNGSRKRESTIDRSRSAQMARMMEDQAGKRFTIAMADQVLRMHRPARAAARLNHLLDEYGVPKYFSALDRLALWAGSKLATIVPSWIMPMIKRKVRQDSDHVIISAEPKPFENYREMRQDSRIRINFNQLGEAVLGEQEAQRRLGEYLQRLSSGKIDYCSVKLSSIVSQISLTGYEHTKHEIKKRLREVYRAAIQGSNGKPCFVNLDMEEYRDLDLTVDIFRDVLLEPEFETLEAGIVLQAYLPDSFVVLQSLAQWAIERKARSGADIKIRLVKGANLAMEQVEASIHDWPQAPYRSKAEVDANFKRMLEFVTRPENAAAMRVGVASHNLFDVAYAFLMRERRQVEQRVEFEMLEGMANAQALEVRQRSGDLLVYTPVCYDNEFESAVAYLVRRLDENTAPGSFLGALFALEEGSPDWEEQKRAFLDACELSRNPQLAAGPNRKQNRLTEQPATPSAEAEFHNEPDTDFSLPANRQWAGEIIESWRDRKIDDIPFVVASSSQDSPATGIGRDPSRPGHQAYRYAQGGMDDVDRALQCAVDAQGAWNDRGIANRAELLRNVARVFAQERGNSIGAMLLDGGKSIVEADAEVSEAVDFANYYSRSLDDSAWFDGTTGNPLGVVVVTPPWNFPFAIPAGGVLAALLAGNSVILKPAPESVLTAWQLAQQLWQAGIPQEVLQFLPVPDNEVGQSLITDDRTAAVILTGSYLTAQLFQSWRPDIKLYAETSGKNCLVITAAADPDLAIKDLVKGAFGHAGQKCSATSIALVQRELYDSQKFRAQLKDAVESLHIGGSWDAAAVVTPIIRQPDENLRRGLDQLEDGESWLVEPKMIDENPCLWRPGVRIGVQPGSWYHRNECFGPVTGLIPFDSLDEAIEIQNSSEFGLTGGIHSLDPKEIKQWRESVEVGNAYINRTTTGAIVRRQPFGGWKDSCVGPGPKAGGPNYVSAFCSWEEISQPKLSAKPVGEVSSLLEQWKSAGLEADLLDDLTLVAQNAAYWWQNEFSQEHDPSQLHGETNHFRYRPRPWLMVRVESMEPTTLQGILRTIVGTSTTNTPVHISLNDSVPELRALDLDKLLDSQRHEIAWESSAECASRLAAMKFGSLRVLGSFDPNTFPPSKIGNIPVLAGPPLANARIELLNYLKEQSVSEIVHRYGNII